MNFRLFATGAGILMWYFIIGAGGKHTTLGDERSAPHSAVVVQPA